MDNSAEYAAMCDRATEAGLDAGKFTLDELWPHVFGDNRIVPLYEIRGYYHWLEDRCEEDHSYCLRNNTLEKCLLSYVMYIKYHKVWDGSNWIEF